MTTAIRKALAALGAAVPIDMTDTNTASEYSSLGDPFKDLLGEGFADYTENGLSHNAVTHQWEFTDAVGLAIILVAEGAANDARTGDADAQATVDGIIRFLHAQFTINPSRRWLGANAVNRWGNLLDFNHTLGVWTDANLAHRLRTWVALMWGWQDYNRPATYVEYWYPDFDFNRFLKNPATDSVPKDFSFLRGADGQSVEPRGAFADISSILSAGYVRPRQLSRSGFLPDGFISHHQDYCNDAAMLAYGYEWLADPVKVATILAGTPVRTRGLLSHQHTSFSASRSHPNASSPHATVFSQFAMTGSAFEVPARWLVYSYNRICFKGHIDWAFLGREYHVEELNFFWERKLIPTVRALVSEHQAALPASLISELQLMLADPITGPSGEFNGNTAFFNSDSMVHRANGWYMSVRMKSKRAQGNEDFESKGKTWHSGSGMLLTKVHGDEVLFCVTNHQPCHLSDDL